MANELLPCPFCGTEAPVLFQVGGFWRIKCLNGCSILITGYNDKHTTIDAWNRRPTQKADDTEKTS